MVTWATIGTASPTDVAAGQHRFAQLVQVAEGFEDQHIHAGFRQRIDLLAECGARFGEGSRAERFDAHAQRTYGAGHEGRIARGFARQLHTGAVDILQLLGHAESRQAHAVGAEGVGLQDLRASLDVVLMDAAHQVRRRQIQLIEGTVEEHAPGVEHGTHGAIGHQHAARQLVTEFLGACASGCHHWETRSRTGHWWPKRGICDCSALGQNEEIARVGQNCPMQDEHERGKEAGAVSNAR